MIRPQISYLKAQILILVLMCVTGIAKAQSGYEIGDQAVDFNLKNIDGKMVSLASYNDVKGFIVVFTCNHCPYAKAYENRMMALDVKYAAKGFPVIAINSNDEKAYPEDSFENMKKRALDKKYTFPYLLDETQQVAKAYGAKATPHVYVLNKTNKGLDVSYIGAIDNDTEDINEGKIKYVENAVDALIAGKKPQITQTKAIGCSIKWKNAE
jgi:peroxiredoxin